MRRNYQNNTLTIQGNLIERESFDLVLTVGRWDRTEKFVRKKYGDVACEVNNMNEIYINFTEPRTQQHSPNGHYTL